MGVDRIVSVDLHYPQIQGYFSAKVPITNLDPSFVAVNYFAEKIQKGEIVENPLIVSPDVNGCTRAEKFQMKLYLKGIDAGYFTKNKTYFRLAIMAEKDSDEKQYRAEGEAKNREFSLIGDKIEGNDCIIIDDMIDSVSLYLLNKA